VIDKQTLLEYLSAGAVFHPQAQAFIAQMISDVEAEKFENTERKFPQRVEAIESVIVEQEQALWGREYQPASWVLAYTSSATGPWSEGAAGPDQHDHYITGPGRLPEHIGLLDVIQHRLRLIALGVPGPQDAHDPED
jgi:hypothetical protein